MDLEPIVDKAAPTPVASGFLYPASARMKRHLQQPNALIAFLAPQ